MAVYVYRCDAHGVTERSLPIGTAGRTTACPTCGGAATRVFTPPRLSLGGDPARRALIEATERSADEPAVVSSPGPRPRRRVPAAAANPALHRLPRP